MKIIILEKSWEKKKDYFKSKNTSDFSPFLQLSSSHKAKILAKIVCLFCKALRLTIKNSFTSFPKVSQSEGKCQNVPGKSQLCT